MKNIKIEIKWAILFTLMMIAWMLFEKLAGLHDIHIDQHYIYTNFVMIPAITFYVFALLDKRKNFYDGTMSYKQGFISGLIITIIVTIFSPLTQYITSTFITPEYFQNVITYTVSKGEMTQIEAENYFNLNNYMVQVIIGTSIMGLITAAIVAIFTKRNRKIII